MASTQTYAWNADNNDWQLAQSVEYLYDGQGNVIERLEYFFEAGNLSLIHKYAYAFDDNGNVLSLTVSQGTGDDQWEVKEVQANNYDENGRVTSYVVTQYTDGAETSASMEEYTYNEKGLLVETILSNKQGTAWNKSSRTTITYNEQDLMETKITANWMVVMWFDLTRFDYVYDDNGNILSYSYYVKGNPWTFVYKFSYTYDENGNRTQYVGTRQEGDAAVDYTKCDYEFDEFGNNTQTTVYNLGEDGNFEPYTCTISAYGEWGITTKTSYNWNNGIWVKQSTYTYYYGDGGVTSIDCINTDAQTVSVKYYNIMGQEVNEAHGITIVVTTYTDGTCSAVKVIK
ncbi:MAG: hypothetical protein IJ613_07830 [Muribaculaceae bacterium]|nr:hypothetical protein [Muribaculaceae bacterium]